MDPKNRLLKQVTIENAAEADEIFYAHGRRRGTAP